MLRYLASFLKQLPSEFPWAVEVRHLSWFDTGKNEERLDGLLSDLRIDRVLFDSRPLNQAPPEDDYEQQSQQRKPKSPLRMTATGQRPMLRLIGRNHVNQVDPYFDEWAPTLARWIAEGKTPYVFTHTPDDRHAPEMARRFWERLRREIPLRPAVASDVATKAKAA